MRAEKRSCSAVHNSVSQLRPAAFLVRFAGGNDSKGGEVASEEVGDIGGSGGVEGGGIDGGGYGGGGGRGEREGDGVSLCAPAEAATARPLCRGGNDCSAYRQIRQ